jgi:hypothetical protein
MAKSEFKTTADTIEISLRDLAKRVDLGLANCAWHMRCLEQKGCIVRVRESDHYHPAVYRVREFTEILQWRKNRGLTHFIQRGHLAAFVDPRIGTPITRFRGQTGTTYRGKVIMNTPDRAHAGVLSTPELSTPDTGVVAVNSSTPAVPDSSTEGVSDLNTPLLREEELTKGTSNLTSSSFALPPPELVNGLHQLLPVFDNEAATILWNDCRTKAADCTVEEVLHFSEVKAASFRTGKIQNPTGFLLVTVPKCFEGQAFKAFREQERKRRAEQQRREEEELVKAQMVKFAQRYQVGNRKYGGTAADRRSSGRF